MFERLKQRIRESLGSAIGGWIRTAGSVSGSLHVEGMDRPAESLLWIYLGMMARADAVSQVPIRISTANDTLVESGPLYDLLSRPNQWMDWVQYLSMIESYLALYNECEVAIVRSPRGMPTELIPLNPRYLVPVTGVHTPTGMRVAVGWEYMDPTVGERILFKPDEIIPMIRYSPYDMTRALWPEKPGKRAMQVDILAQEQNLAIFKNGGMPDVIFETEQNLREDQANEFLQRWQDRYGGSANSHKPGILTNGLKAHGIGLSPTELQFFDGRRMSRSEQIALMRVKPAMVGLMEGETGLSQGSSTVEQYAAWWRSMGLGELAMIAAAHQQFLVDRQTWAGSVGGREMTGEQRRTRDEHRKRMRLRGVRANANSSALQVWFDEHEIEELMDQRLQKIDILDKLLNRGWQPDESADYLGLRLPPHPTNQATIPFSLQPVGDLGGAPAAAPAAPREEAPSRLDEMFDQLADALSSASAPAREREAAAEIPARYRALRKTFDTFVGAREKAAARKWSRFFIEQRGRVADRYEEYRQGIGQREDPALADLDVSEDGIVHSIFPREHEDDALGARLSGLWAQHLRDGFEFFGQHEAPAGAKVSFQIDDPRVMQAIESRRIQGVGVNETTERQLRDLVRTAFTEGDTAAQFADRLAEYFNKQVGDTAARPMTAARTQTSGIVNEGRMIAARDVGGLTKGWLHGAPDASRSNHVDAQARYSEKPIPIDEKFIIFGAGGQSYACDAPGSTELPVGEVANCTCMVTFHAAKGTA